jgi:A/G-specific adenine glycosylase
MMTYKARQQRSRRRAEPKATLSEVQINRTQQRLLRSAQALYQPNFPWRSETNPWLALVAEFLLQRTRASQVAAIYDQLGQRFSTPDDMVRRGASDLQRIMDKLGLHGRSQMLVGVAREIVANNDILPETMEELTSLKGIGPYTAAAWLSLHRNKRAVMIDSNVCRWLSRMTGLPYNRDPRNLVWVHELADKLTPRRKFKQYNYAVLDFTMTICTPRNPKCTACFLKDDCIYGNSLSN